MNAFPWHGMDEHQTNPMCLDGQSCVSGAHITEGYKANLIRESHRWGGWLNHVHFRNNIEHSGLMCLTDTC